MKRYWFLGFLFFVLAGLSTAQDVITTRDGKDIKAKVLEISSTEIKYLDFENMEGPTYVLDRSEVRIIRYQNGKNELFADDTMPQKDTCEPTPQAMVTEGMEYKKYCSLYDPRNYTRQPGDTYNPSLAGVMSFFIPGLGQCICDEWGRGLAFFGADVIVSLTTINAVAQASQRPNTPRVVFAAAMSAFSLTTGIWNIVDAVRVAKIKNMYYRDIMELKSTVSYGVTPYVSYIELPGNSSPAFGLSFQVSF